MKEAVQRRSAEISERLKALGDPLSQCDYLMMTGLSRPEIPEIKVPRCRIGGCKTAIWIETGEKDGTVWFRADSDSLLVRGVLALFDEMYAGVSASEAAAYPPLFIEEISEEVIYPEIRQNGLKKCYEAISSPIKM